MPCAGKALLRLLTAAGAACLSMTWFGLETVGPALADALLLPKKEPTFDLDLAASCAKWHALKGWGSAAVAPSTCWLHPEAIVLGETAACKHVKL